MAKVSPANRGMALEAALNFMHEQYAAKGEKVRIRHYGISGKWFGSKMFVPLPKQEQPPDYHGVIAGRFVAFDAKQTNNARRWTLDNRYLHQLDRLSFWACGGAVCWFAVEATAVNTLFLRRVLPFTTRDSLSFSFEDLSSPVLLRVMAKGNLYDWLPIVAENWLQY